MSVSIDVEPARSPSVERYARLLARAPVQPLRALVEAAARLCGVLSAAVSLVDESAQSFAIAVGPAVPALPSALSFCGSATLHGDLYVVPNAILHDRFRSSPIVAGSPGVRFYALSRRLQPVWSRVTALQRVPATPSTRPVAQTTFALGTAHAVHSTTR